MSLVRVLLQHLYRLLSAPWHLYLRLISARPIRFTRFGIFYILFSLAVGAAAINTGNNLLYMILGILLGLIVVSGVLSDSCLWRIETRWNLAGSLYAEEKAVIQLTLGKRRFPGVMIQFTARWDGAAALSQAFAFWIPTKGETVVELATTPRRRGYFRLASVRYASQFPFGLFEKYYTSRPAVAWIAYPRRLAVDPVLASLKARHFGFRPAPHAGAGDTPFLLRDYREGDSARLVHWKSSAKRGRLLVHEMQNDLSDADWLVVRAWPRHLARDEQEDFISFVASLIQKGFERGAEIGLETPGASFPPESSRQWLHSVLRFLALLNLETSAGSDDFIFNSKKSSVDAFALWKAYRVENRR
jgi:uncharacterized protein (DUF58 family)